MAFLRRCRSRCVPHIWKRLRTVIRSGGPLPRNCQYTGTLYQKSIHIWSRGLRNNHLPLSLIPTAIARWCRQAWLRRYRREWKQITSCGRILQALKVAQLLFEPVLRVCSATTNCYIMFTWSGRTTLAQALIRPIKARHYWPNILIKELHFTKFIWYLSRFCRWSSLIRCQ